jgi:hypothetical protein
MGNLTTPWSILAVKSSIDSTRVRLRPPVVSAEHAGATYDVSVHLKTQDAAAGGIFQYRPVKDPVVERISPPTGPNSGGCKVTFAISGVKDAGAVVASGINVQFGGVVAVVEAGSIQAADTGISFAVHLPASGATSSVPVRVSL